MESGSAKKGGSIQPLPSSFGIKEAIAVLLLGAVLGIAVNLCFMALGLTQSCDTFTEVANSQFSRPFLEGLILYGLFAPVMEEGIFRLGVYRLLRRFTPFFASMIVSAFVFGMYHGNLVQGAYGFLMGLILAWLVEKYQGLSAPVLFHAGANIGVWVMVYLG